MGRVQTEYKKYLPSRLQRGWRYLCDDRPSGHSPLLPLLRLREAMIKSGEFPADLLDAHIEKYSGHEEVSSYE
ncbi:hypothetical protein BDV19DRAFT_354021 [Aspergillus venezuelensis]